MNPTQNVFKYYFHISMQNMLIISYSNIFMEVNWFLQEEGLEIFERNWQAEFLRKPASAGVAAKIIRGFWAWPKTWLSQLKTHVIVKVEQCLQRIVKFIQWSPSGRFIRHENILSVCFIRHPAVCFIRPINITYQ